MPKLTDFEEEKPLDIKPRDTDSVLELVIKEQIRRAELEISKLDGTYVPPSPSRCGKCNLPIEDEEYHKPTELRHLCWACINLVWFPRR